MGYGAVKYADLKNSRTTNYKFSYDAMLDLKGNTAVYLLYAHARIAAIVRKSGKDIEALAGSGKVVVEHPKEVELALALCRWVGVGCRRCLKGAASGQRVVSHCLHTSPAPIWRLTQHPKFELSTDYFSQNSFIHTNYPLQAAGGHRGHAGRAHAQPPDRLPVWCE
jgi:hypothetical protein